MKPWTKITRNASLNMLWIMMFIPLWPIEDLHILRLLTSFAGAWVLAFF